MKPSDIELHTVMPLTGTFGRTEAEAAAALVIAGLALGGDEWRPLEWSELREHAEELSAYPWLSNPFARPDVDDLAARGFATVTDDRRTVELTPQALEVLKSSHWNKAVPR